MAIVKHKPKAKRNKLLSAMAQKLNEQAKEMAEIINHKHKQVA